MIESGKTIGTLAEEVFTRSQALFEKQTELLEAEVAEKLADSEKNLLVLAFSGITAIAAIFFLGLSLSLLGVQFTSIPLWGYCLLWGILLSGATPLLYRQSRFTLVPKTTIESVKENIQCLKTHIF